MIPGIDFDFDADIRYRIIRRRRRRRGIALLVVFLPLGLVADDFVGFGELPVLRFSHDVARIPVWVDRDGLLPEGSPDLVGAGVLLDAQHGVVVRFNTHRIILSWTLRERKKIGS
jgi:hypothetical protein